MLFWEGFNAMQINATGLNIYCPPFVLLKSSVTKEQKKMQTNY